MIRQENPSYSDAKLPTPAEVVCFGSFIATILMVVDEWPERNFGCVYKEQHHLIAQDAAMIACMLRGWDIRSGLVGSAVGHDLWGEWIANQIKSVGILEAVRLDPQIATMVMTMISDTTGARTYFWKPDPKVLATLDSADLSLLPESRLLYVDWYDEDHIIRPMDEARRLNIPVFLNLEHLHQEPDLLARYAGRATICQAVTDAAQRGDEPPLQVAHKLLNAGVEIAIVTLAGEGCLVVRNQEVIRVFAPPIQAIDSFGAGATFSAGFIYGYLQGWTLEEIARFATAAASIKVSRIGLEPPDLAEIKKLAVQLKVE